MLIGSNDRVKSKRLNKFEEVETTSTVQQSTLWRHKMTMQNCYTVLLKAKIKIQTHDN